MLNSSHTAVIQRAGPYRAVVHAGGHPESRHSSRTDERDPGLPDSFWSIDSNMSWERASRFSRATSKCSLILTLL